jgi:excisionase family DNA binding protein
MSTDTYRPMFTVKDVSQILGVSQTTVRRLIETGELVAYQLAGPGTSIRIDRDEFDRWLRRDNPQDLRKLILQADEDGDEEGLAWLRAEYREKATFERPAPPPELLP